MNAAIRLRLLEARRRGGLWLLAIGLAVVIGVALWGADTQAGRYGLASDIATVLAYLGAVFFGAFPLATDRERKRAYLPGASPVTPWAWAAGNAIGGALVAGGGALALFLAAGLACASTGGIETRLVAHFENRGRVAIPTEQPLPIRLRDDAKLFRLATVTVLEVEETVGTPDGATIEVNGEPYAVPWNRPLVVPVTENPLRIRNVSPEFTVFLEQGDSSALAGERAFLGNAAGASIAPAFGAAALAALGTAAGAHLSAAVAALVTTLLLLLASMKGFLLETFEQEERLAAQEAAADPHAGHDHAGHDHDHGHDHHHHAGGPSVEGTFARVLAKGTVGVLLRVTPDFTGLDRTDRVARGEWTGLRGAGDGLLIALVALACAAVLGGLGVHARRVP